MLKVILEALSGLILLIIGIFLFVLFILSMADNTSNILFIIVSILFIIGGCLLLFISGRSDETVTKKAKETVVNNSGIGLEGVLARNNEMNKEFTEASDQKDKLKLLEAAGDLIIKPKFKLKLLHLQNISITCLYLLIIYC